MISVKNITPPEKIDWGEKFKRLKFLAAPQSVIAEAERKAKEIGVEEKPPAFHRKGREYPAPQKLGDILQDFVYKVVPRGGKDISYCSSWEVKQLLLNSKEISPNERERILGDGDVVEVVVEVFSD